MIYKRTHRPVLDFQLYIPFITIRTELMNECHEARSFTYIRLEIAIYKYHWYFRLWKTSFDKEVDESKTSLFSKIKNWNFWSWLKRTIYKMKTGNPSIPMSSKDVDKVSSEYRKLIIENAKTLNLIAREIDPEFSKDRAVSAETILLMLRQNKLKG